MWDAILENLRWADFLDIGLVAVFIYFLTLWLLSRTSRGTFVGVLAIGGCYLISHWLQLYLTRQLFQAGLLVLVLALVVILQQDIRRGFERLASLRWRRQGGCAGSTEQVVDAIMESVALMSEARRGALLVFPGKEPLERLTHGGFWVDACVTPALLQSLFNPSSPTHDGAAIMRDDRLERIGVLLPLSTHLQNLGCGGTRHAAALGLAEHCDALVVVVSEERGTISIAQNGALESVDEEALRTRLSHHRTHALPRKEPFVSRRWFARHLTLKLASIAIAVALWSIFAFRVDSIQRSFAVPIEFRNLPNDLVLEKTPPAHARMMLSGSERDLDEVDAATLVIAFDLAEARADERLLLATRQGIMHLPIGVHVIDVEPRWLTVTVLRRSPDPDPDPDPSEAEAGPRLSRRLLPASP